MGTNSPGGPQRCRLILQRCLAIQLNKPGHTPEDLWMYDSGYMIFQVGYKFLYGITFLFSELMLFWIFFLLSSRNDAILTASFRWFLDQKIIVFKGGALSQLERMHFNCRHFLFFI